MTAALKGGVVKGDCQTASGGRLRDPLLELCCAVDGDPVAEALHCQAQGGVQAVRGGLARDLQAVAVVADGAAADAIDDGSLLRDVVRHGRMARLGLAAALDGVALEVAAALACAQRGQGLVVALHRLGLEPVGPRAALRALLDRLTALPVLAVDLVQVGAQSLVRLRVHQSLCNAPLAQQLDSGAAQPVAAHRGFNQAVTTPAQRVQLALAHGPHFLAFRLIPGV
ncbi:Uncharacterised protein [Enterobacter hormaechei]|nr:Uncharacterised protein [Enterobacter hormaechei]